MKKIFSEKETEGKSLYWQLLMTAGLSTVLFLILFMIRGLYPVGNGSVLMIDLHSQYTPLLYRFYDVVSGLKNLFMDFKVSGGANLYTDTINEVINPFNYLLFFFGRERIYLAINVLLWAYVTAAAVSANLFLQKIWPRQRQWNLVFGLVYGFSGFAAYQFQIIKWMIFPVIFPIYVLALVRLLCEKKGGWYALLLAYQLMLNLQLGAMTLFATLFGTGIYFFFCMEKEEKKRAMCRLAVYTILGAAVSAAVLLPGILYLLDSARGGENSSYFAVMKQHGLDDLFERLFLTVHPIWLGMFCYFAVKWILARKTSKNNWKCMSAEGKFLVVLNGFLFLTVLAQPSNLLWHLGSYMCFPVRYAYILFLAELCCFKWMLLEREALREKAEKNQVLRAWQLGSELCAIGLCVWALYLTLGEAEQITQAFSTLAISRVCPAQTLLVCVILGILTAAALLAFLAGKRKRRTMTIVACTSGLCLFLFILLPQNYAVRLMNEDAYKTMNKMHQEQQKDTVTASDVFARVADDEDLPLNAALVTGDSTLTGYFPAGSQLVYAGGLEQLGYLTPWVSTRSWGGTMISDGILGVQKEETAVVLGKSLILNEPVSLLAEETKRAAQDGPLALQACLGDVIAGSKKHAEEKILRCLDAADLYSAKKDGLLISVTGEQAVYLDAGYPASDITVLVDGEEVKIPEKASSEGPHRLIYLGTFTDREILLQVFHQGGDWLTSAASLENAADTAQSACLKVGILDLNAWKAAVQSVKTAETVLLSDQGTLQVDVRQMDAGQTLFIPVAAIDGWQCSADGKQVDITPILGGFMGITLEEKAEMLELGFYPPGLKGGLAISAAALLSLMLCCALNGKKRLSGKLETSQNLWVPLMAMCYKIVWAAGFLVIYVVPNIGMVCYMVYRILAG